MTACVNRKHTKKVAAVVTASLVGALSLGAAPVAAVADTGIETLVNDAESAFSRGTVTLGGSDLKETDGVYWATANGDGTPLDIYATQVTPLGNYPVEVAGSDSYETTIYKADANGDATGETVEKIVEPGKYVISVKALGGQYAGGAASVNVDVKAASLKDIDWFDASSEGTSDQSLTFNGSTLEIGFEAKDVAFTEGDDYTVRVFKKGTDNVPDAEVAEIREAGDYVAYVEGKGQYVGESKEIQFNVAQFDMSEADIVVDDVIGSNTKPTHPTKVSYSDGAHSVVELDPSLVDLTFVSGIDGDAEGSDLFNKTGKYSFSASYSDDENIIGEYLSSVEVNKVAEEAAFEYDGAAVEDSYFINEAEGEKFSLDKIAVYNGDKKLDSNQYEVTVQADGMSNALAKEQLELQNADTYTVTVHALPEKNDWEVGGSATFTVTIVIDSIDADANVYIYDNETSEVVSSVTKNYDGEAIYATDFIAKAFDENGDSVADSDTSDGGALELALYDEDGNKIDSATDAGSYTLKVESDKYELTGTTEIPVTINKVDLSELQVNALSDWYGAKYLDQANDGYTWTDLDIRYDTKVADSDKNDERGDKEGWDIISWLPGELNGRLTAERFDEEKDEWVEVPSQDLGKTVGLHRITLTGNADLAKNYTFANDDYTTVVEFVVAYGEHCVFNDVKPGDWFFEVVYRAQSNSWMNGYAAGSSVVDKIFGANDQITRGQVACVLFNMAGGELDETDSDFYNEVKGWKSFDDVDGKQYYGEAIAWAKATGVVNGYADGTFKADAPVTREELAAMLANYAERIDQVDTSVVDSEGALSDMPDAGSVSDWATEVVAWAVENSVMGNGGSINPGADITRAEVAAMVCNYADLD